MTTVLVANRGEIALRIFRTAKRMGMRTVAVYSEADAGALHVRAADEAVCIGGPAAADSYLRSDRIIEAAKDSAAGLVHPGYGFLAEDFRFAAGVVDAGLVFVGPPPDVLRVSGDKAAARDLAASAGVGVLPAAYGDDAVLRKAAEEIGFPVVVKPAGGGGGKGMAIVRDPAGLDEALGAARRLATAAFGDDRLLVERYVEGARHVEVQILADGRGTVLHLGERDCSLQRRHQKVIEEAPAPSLDDDVRQDLHRSAVAFAQAANYVGAGTCEFLVAPDGSFGFIEMNARLQVEHPVTELVCGLDLVELQLKIAMGEPLELEQEHIVVRGHAVEARVYAEDPEAGFLPQAGTISHVRWPEQPHVRVDNGFDAGSDVPPHYDPLLAKIVAWGGDREEALTRLTRALEETEILGVRTNVAFLREVLADPDVVQARHTTQRLDEIAASQARRSGIGETAAAVVAAAHAEGVLVARLKSNDPWERLAGWRGGADEVRASVVLHAGEDEVVVTVEGSGPFRVGEFVVESSADANSWLLDGRRAAAIHDGDRWLVWIDGRQHELAVGPKRREGAATGPSRLESPLPGRVMAVRVEPGDEVGAGAELVVIEAMKMEHAIVAPADGTVAKVLCSPGDQVERGQPLVELR